MPRPRLASLSATVAMTAMLLLVAACGDNSFLVPPPLVADPILIDAEWDPTTPTAEQVVDINVTVRNQGGFDAKTFKLRILVVINPCTPAARTTGNYEFEFTDGLRSGAAALATVSHDFNNTPGTYGLYLFLDEDEDIFENASGYDGETNNTYTCGQVVDNQGRVTLSAGETFIVVLGASGNNGGGIIGVVPKASN